MTTEIDETPSKQTYLNTQNRKHKDYSELIAKEQQLLAKVDPKKPLPACLTNQQFWQDDYAIYIRELERFVNSK